MNPLVFREEFFDPESLRWYRRLFDERNAGKNWALSDIEFLNKCGFVINMTISWCQLGLRSWCSVVRVTFAGYFRDRWSIASSSISQPTPGLPTVDGTIVS